MLREQCTPTPVVEGWGCEEKEETWWGHETEKVTAATCIHVCVTVLLRSTCRPLKNVVSKLLTHTKYDQQLRIHADIIILHMHSRLRAKPINAIKCNTNLVLGQTHAHMHNREDWRHRCMHVHVQIVTLTHTRAYTLSCGRNTCKRSPHLRVG